MKKKIAIIIAIFVVILLVCFVRWYNSSLRADEILERDFEELSQVVEYMNSLEDVSSAYINSADGTMLVQYKDGKIAKDVEITDKDALDTISRLLKKGYLDIDKEENSISFDRWKNLFGCFRGFAFSYDSSGELDIQFLTEQRALSKADWYYYVSDYNEWRSLQYN